MVGANAEVSPRRGVAMASGPEFLSRLAQAAIIGLAAIASAASPGLANGLLAGQTRPFGLGGNAARRRICDGHELLHLFRLQALDVTGERLDLADQSSPAKELVNVDSRQPP